MGNKNVFRAINIRKGLELEVPIRNIFKIDTSPSGDILAMEIFTKKVKNLSGLKQKDKKKILDNKEFLMYSTKLEKHDLKDDLIAYVSEAYFVYTDDNENIEIKTNKIESEKNIEITFVNTKQLDYFQFIRNIMKAQEFTGGFDKSEFKFQFLGVGSFSIDEYIDSHNILIHSNMEMLNFFIFKNKILSGIDKFVSGLYDKDIEEQKKYLTKEEYKNLVTNSALHRKVIQDEFKKFLTNLKK